MFPILFYFFLTALEISLYLRINTAVWKKMHSILRTEKKAKEVLLYDVFRNILFYTFWHDLYVFHLQLPCYLDPVGRHALPVYVQRLIVDLFVIFGGVLPAVGLD